VDERLQKGLAGERVAVADGVADLALEGSDVVLGERRRRVVLVDRQLLAAGAEAGELAVEVFDALGAGGLGHGAGLERAEVAAERFVGLADVGVDAGEIGLPLWQAGLEVGVGVGDRVAHERLVGEDGGELVEDRVLERLGGEAVGVAGGGAVAVAGEADVVAVAAAVAVGGGADVALAAALAAQQAGQGLNGLPLRVR
jgi:hypothetical protein